MTKSKTTWLGIFSLISLIGTTANNLIQGIPIQWEVIVPGVISAVGLIFAGDANPVQ